MENEGKNLGAAVEVAALALDPEISQATPKEDGRERRRSPARSKQRTQI